MQFNAVQINKQSKTALFEAGCISSLKTFSNFTSFISFSNQKYKRKDISMSKASIVSFLRVS